MFVCVKDGSEVATVGCANLRMKQDWGDKYILSSLTSSNNGWHKGWFYLRNDSKFAWSTFTENSIANAPSSWTDGRPKLEKEKMFKNHLAVLARLHDAGVSLATVIN
jgi:hypothetical protein